MHDFLCLALLWYLLTYVCKRGHSKKRRDTRAINFPQKFCWNLQLGGLIRRSYQDYFQRQSWPQEPYKKVYKLLQETLHGKIHWDRPQLHTVLWKAVEMVWRQNVTSKRTPVFDDMTQSTFKFKIILYFPAIALRNIDLWSCHFRLIFCCLCSKGFTRNLLSHDFVAEKNFNFHHKSSHTIQ